jgi:small subunit ribosomal protein S8
MATDSVTNILNQIMNAKRAGKNILETKNHSKLLISVLALGKLKGYIKNYSLNKNILSIEFHDLKKCKALSPRYTVKVSQIEKYESRYLPAKGLGILIISTPLGLLTNETAREKNIGGSIVAYMY